MAAQKENLVIIGAGVIGCSCALALIKALPNRFDITVVADSFTPNTTSDIAGGLWFPYATSHPKVYDWCERTRQFYSNLDESYGVEVPKFIWYEHGEESRLEREKWAHLFPDLKKIPASGRLPKHANEEWHMTAPLIQTPMFMSRLMAFLAIKGVKFEEAKVESIESLIATKKPHFLLNCTGLGARTLVNDESLFPIRGILLKVKPTPSGLAKLRGQCYCFDDNPDGMSYVFPRPDAVWVGGVALENDWRLTSTSDDAGPILQRAIDMCPELEGCEILERKVGLRPGRPTIRLDSEWKDGCFVVHNYGHGGSGWTVMWGCALDVVEMIKSSRSNSTAAKL